MFENEILLRLKRLYSKDETVKMIVKELSKSNVEYGKLRSYISELEDKVSFLENQNSSLKKQISAVQNRSNKVLSGEASAQLMRNKIVEIKKLKSTISTLVSKIKSTN